MSESDSDDNIPLAILKNKPKDMKDSNHDTQIEMQTHGRGEIFEMQSTNIPNVDNQDGLHVAEYCSDEGGVASDIMSEESSNEMSEYDYDSDKDPEFNPGQCEVRKCKAEVWAACPDCEILVCFNHFNEDISSCTEHGKRTRKRKEKARAIVENTVITTEQAANMEMTADSGLLIELQNSEAMNRNVGMQITVPELYIVEGSGREVVTKKVPRTNKQKEAKRKRNMGVETSTTTKKKVAAKQMKVRCKGNTCGRQCSTITDDQRQDIFQSYHALGDLRLQREFLARHIRCSQTKRKSSANNALRRQITKQYLFTVHQNLVPVCKVFFLNTLGVSEQFTRTALSKVNLSGTIEKKKRGGIQSEAVRARNQMIRQEISDHIDRFPRAESHFCRSSTTREYLYPDLTKQKMFDMFLQEWMPRPAPPSYALYKKIFKEKHLSIHRPKKDQCSLCVTYLQGDERVKTRLRAQYETHIGEKQKVREIKGRCKEEAQKDETVLCASFDLQQVIYLPISQENAIFYKRRLSNYNFTFYNIGNRDCHCFTWDETTSKRGSSEISTAVQRTLKFYDDKGIKKAYLFSDGCSGQNKNSIMPAMMLYTLSTSKNLEEISLRFFESNHGQNEGDSAHSAINHALKAAGVLFLPS